MKIDDKEKLDYITMELLTCLVEYCSTTEILSRDVLDKYEKKEDNKKMSSLEAKSIHSMYLRVISHALLRAAVNINTAEKIAKAVGIVAVQEDLSSGVDVPTFVVDAMLDEMNNNKKDK